MTHILGYQYERLTQAGRQAGRQPLLSIAVFAKQASGSYLYRQYLSFTEGTDSRWSQEHVIRDC